jgi:hypothetical protein
VRYYDIKIFKAGTTTLVKEYTSFPKVGGSNQNDPGALNIIFDIYLYTFAKPAGQPMIQIWGVGLDDIAQAANFTGCQIELYAGFQKGLPLNNPKQAGLIMSGTIWQSFANWQGTDMTLDFVVYGSGATADQDANLSFSWTAGTPLATAIATTLKTAFHNLKQNIQVNPKLVLAHDEIGTYQSLVQLAQTLKPITQDAIGGDYQGVDIVLTPDLITVYDGSTQAAPTVLAFQDMIGQPTWIENQIIQFVCPMRSDLIVPNYIKMPQGLLGVPGAVVTTTASQPQARQKSAFNGVFLINQVHHMGNFRQPTGDSWISVFNAVVVPGDAKSTSTPTPAAPSTANNSSGTYNTPQYGPS